MKKLPFKYFFRFFIPVVISFLGLIIYNHIQKQENNSKLTIEALKEQVNLIENLTADYLIDKNFSAIDSIIKSNFSNSNTFIIVLSDSEQVIFSTDDLEKKEYFKLKEKLNQIIKFVPNVENFEFNELQGINSIYFKTIRNNKQKSGYLFITKIDSSYSEINNQLVNNILIGVILSFILSLLLTYLFSGRVSKSLKKFAEAFQSISSGDFNVQVELPAKDDFYFLADNFNEMSEKIKRLFNFLSKQKDELNSVISSIQEGLLVIDKNDIIVLSNDSMNRILDRENLEGNKYGDFIKNSRLWQLINKTRDKKKSNRCELQIGQDFYLCTADLMESKEEVILIFFNITEAKKLEIVKKDFITNVSHELRTPLTSIKGFIETLMDEIDDDYKQYLNIINNNTRRLILIVEDLLTLSELENKDTQLIITEVNLPELIKNISVIFEQKLKDKQINLIHNFEDDIPLIQADAFRLEQLMINLIDNAIKYSHNGEIEVRLSKDSGKVLIEVKDTGVGIPKEHQSRIFERFYTVDRSHSRRTGGTGLGLSIVKHIVQAHNGEISIESEIGKGTSFIVKIPEIHSFSEEEAENNSQVFN